MNKNEVQLSHLSALLVKIAFESTGPFGIGSGDGEPGEELRDGARGRGPINFP